jgi:hypothetical protein
MAEPITPPIQKTSALQQALETIEALSVDDQLMLIQIIQQRLNQQPRSALLQQVATVEQEYAIGNFKVGSVADLMAELDD